MSALGQKQTLDCCPLMSALPPKADMVQHGGNVRFVPKADIRIGSDSVRRSSSGSLTILATNLLGLIA
jgi:hypothetical protein